MRSCFHSLRVPHLVTLLNQLAHSVFAATHHSFSFTLCNHQEVLRAMLLRGFLRNALIPLPQSTFSSRAVNAISFPLAGSDSHLVDHIQGFSYLCGYWRGRILFDVPNTVAGYCLARYRKVMYSCSSSQHRCSLLCQAMLVGPKAQSWCCMR